MKFKNKLIKSTFFDLAPILMLLLVEFDLYFSYHGHELVITEGRTTLEHDQSIGRKEASHRQGRAVDIRVWGLSDDFRNSFIRHFNEKYYFLGAMSRKTGKRNLIVDEGNHLHAQVRADIYDLKTLNEILNRLEIVGN